MTPGGDVGPALIDTHAHLADPRLEADLDGVLSRAMAAGVVQVLAIGTTAEDSATVLAITRRRRGIAAVIGVHPNEADVAGEGDWGAIRDLALASEVVALGETGLDRHHDRTPFSTQQEWFGRHLELAAELDLPVVIHCREAEADVIALLSRLGRPVRGVLHSFTGDSEQAEALLALGLHLSFAGMLTFANKSLDRLREVAAEVPSGRILVETDSPYLSPHPHRGESNEPRRVAVTAARLAQVRGVSLAEIAAITTANARALFRLDAGRLLESDGARRV